ncbi:MAG TPA: hypothetical protein VFK54_00095 [Candidatus Limnocylindrales bacterium]|nr:hypothetical protein [Candidatus Limnocylindrales bacterium]
MPRVFVDPSAVVEPATRPADSSAVRFSPGAVDALRHLTEAECEVVLLDPAGDAQGEALPDGVRLARDLPRPLGPDVWFVTADPGSRFGRPRGARTILVGPKRPSGPIPLPRYDVEARDLGSAVIEILTRQAMV